MSAGLLLQLAGGTPVPVTTRRAMVDPNWPKDNPDSSKRRIQIWTSFLMSSEPQHSELCCPYRFARKSRSNASCSRWTVEHPYLQPEVPFPASYHHSQSLHLQRRFGLRH